MFRRIPSSLPKDFTFPADLKQLGYEINEMGRIRSIEYPDRQFHYFISKNERYVEMQREAFNICIRNEVMSRLKASSMTITRLPLGTPADQNHVPILTSANLAVAKRVIVYVGEPCQDLGILAYRLIGSDTINSGSVVEFVQNINSRPGDDAGTVITNLGQLIWHRRGKQAMSQSTWFAIPRETAVSPSMRLDPVKNSIPMNEDLQSHITCVFEQVLGQMTDKGAKIYVIGMGDGALEVFEYLQNNWGKWKDRVDAMAVGASHVWNTQIIDEDFGKFWGRRGRAYMVSEAPVGTPLTGRKGFGCNCYSSGEAYYLECIMPKVHDSILDYFQVVASNPGYEVDAQDLDDEEEESAEEEIPRLNPEDVEFI